jgi:uncharacterized protein (TIGR02231 family)
MKFFQLQTRICKLIIFLFFFHIPHLDASEEPQPINPGKIQKVRLYTDRAEIFRQVPLQVPMGQSEILLGPLPGSIIPDSIRIFPATDSSIQIGNFSIQKAYKTRFLDDSIQKQEARTQQFRLKLNSINDELNTLNDQINYIENLNGETIPSNILPGQDYWDSILEFKATRGKIRRDRFRETQIKSQKAEKEFKVEEKLLQDMKEGTKKEATYISVNIGSKDSIANLNVSYQIRNTSWKPAYRVRTDTIKKSIQLEYMGLINQKTGEDWNNVSLELTTSQPSRGTTPPKLRPWVIDYLSDTQLFGASSGTMSMQPMRKKERRQVENIFADAQVIKTGSSFTYQIPEKQTIATGTRNYRALILSKYFDTDLIYTAIPKNSQNVFLKANTQNSSPYQLLPGSAKNFVDGSFVGKSWFKNTAPGQNLELGLGLDDSIKVKRKLLKKEGGDGGIFNQTQKQRYIFEISLENFKDIPIQVELKDQLPLSYQEDIKVRINEIKPEPKKTDNQNFITWRIDLEPLEKKVITLDFQVEYPEGKKVKGL